MTSKYADVILPLPIDATFTYLIPQQQENRVGVGSRVIVPFGRSKFYTAIVWKIHTVAPVDFEVKSIALVLDDSPVLLPYQFKLWKWISDYYLCTLGDVYKAALPAGLKLESETVIQLNLDFKSDLRLSDKENQILNILEEEEEIAISKLTRRLEGVNLMPVIKKLLEAKAIELKEELKSRYKPKTERMIALVDRYQEERELSLLFEELNRAPKQQELVMKYIELSGWLTNKKPLEIARKKLLDEANISSAICTALVKRGVFYCYSQNKTRLEDFLEEVEVEDAHELSEPQGRAYEEIISSFQDKDVTLLHGVTASGKTEVYIKLIEYFLKQGKQVLYLLPEIALTTQITARLKRVFGNQLGVYHSRFSDAERVEVWMKQLSESPFQVILGVRSSVFLPFKNLGLIIIDEEHETTYKQQDPAPRYHARDLSIVLTTLLGGKSLLGTATPSIESWDNTQKGKYGLVQLSERFKEVKLPHIIPVDIKELFRKKRMIGQFSPVLVEQMTEAFERKEQVILFQNRRGYAPLIECTACGWVPKCTSCDVSLTLHKGLNVLSCHYCGHTEIPPHKCPSCGGEELSQRGFGTERIEDEVKRIFPQARCTRMDFDTTRTKKSYEQIISSFQSGEANVLIGTQMVSKGLDFDKVSVVGILNADTMLNYPDFRSYERAFQMIAQVAGRAGRKEKQGIVILQTKSIDHPIIQQVISNDYEGMVRDQLTERRLFSYPPYFRLIYVYLKHRDSVVLDRAANLMAGKLRLVFNNRVLGPDNPPVARIQGLYIKKLVLKIETGSSIKQARYSLRIIQEEVIRSPGAKSLQVYYDVDPM